MNDTHKPTLRRLCPLCGEALSPDHACTRVGAAPEKTAPTHRGLACLREAIPETRTRRAWLASAIDQARRYDDSKGSTRPLNRIPWGELDRACKAHGGRALTLGELASVEAWIDSI